MLLIKNAHLITMEEKNFNCGYMLVNEKIIAEIGSMENFALNEADYDVLDAAGKIVIPGFIDAHCHVGMWEESIGEAGSDGNEETSPITPQLRAIDALNPFDEAFLNARRAGVTTVVTGPGSANVLGGQFAAVKTDGISIDEMAINSFVAQKAALGENPKQSYGAKNQSPKTRMATAALLRETLFNAREYAAKWDEYNKNPEKEKPELSFMLESLKPVVCGNVPLKVHVHRADDILTAIRIAEEFNIKITLDHCTEGHLIADILKEKNYPVILGPTLGSKSKSELKNMSFDIYKILADKDIEYAIATDHPEIPIEFLPLCAMLAVQSGITKPKALAAITINAAKSAGIADRVGSLKAGKDADFIIMTGEPLTMEAKPFAVFINGKKIS